MATIAFVTGVPRSGTTALARLLTSHPDIAIMHERYGRAIADPDFGPKYFGAERVRTYDEGDGGRRAFDHPVTQAALAKWDTAKVVGVKAPSVAHVLRVAARFKGAKVIAIIRDPFSVAQSYQARADRKNDPSWPNTCGYEAAVQDHNKAMVTLLAAQKANTGNLLVVQYEHVFTPGADLTAIFRFLGVSPEVGAETAIEVQSVRDAAHLLRGRIAAHVSAAADFGPYRALVRTCALQPRKDLTTSRPATETDASRGSLKLGRFLPPFLRRSQPNNQR